MTKRILSVIIVLMMVAGAVPLTISASEDATTTPTPAPTSSDRSRASPIRINSDAELMTQAGTYGWPGDGLSVNNPVIIQNLNISGTGAGGCIFIGNTSRYLNIENCTLDNAWVMTEPYYFGGGINLVNAKYATLKNNTCTKNHIGIYVNGSTGLTMVNNTCTKNVNGIICKSTQLPKIGGNTVTDSNATAISVIDPASIGAVWIHNNTCKNNGATTPYYNGGILLSGPNAKNNTIENNYLDNNSNGLVFRQAGTGGNIVRENIISNCTMFMIQNTNMAGGQIFYHNVFMVTAPIGDNLTGGDQFNRPWPVGGNYWSNNTGSDIRWGPSQNSPGPDGMGDNPYYNLGPTKDNLPWLKARGWQKVRNNNTGTWHETIQWAVDNATNNDQLYITDNNYYENVYVQNKNVFLDGNSQAGVKLQGINAGENVLTLFSRFNTVSNMTVIGSNSSSGISVRGDNNTIQRVLCNGNSIGMTLENTKFSYIQNCSLGPNSNNGLVLLNGASSNLVIDTIISKNPLNGAEVRVNADKNTFYNCTIINNDGNGMLFTQNINGNKVVNCTISGSKQNGIVMSDAAMTNEVFGGTINQNGRAGIYFFNCKDNTVRGVVIEKNAGPGIIADPGTINNLVHHNQFVSNNGGARQAWEDATSANRWNLPYPLGGNYWNDYNGLDMMRGDNQDIEGSDGYGDTPYNINKTADKYPLMDLPGTEYVLGLESVTVSPVSAIIGVDRVNITATVKNPIPRTIRVNMSFQLDNNESTYLGCAVGNISSGIGQVVLSTNFSVPNVTAGDHNVTAMFMYRQVNYSAASNNITLVEPWSDVVLNWFDVNRTIVVGRGEEVTVTVSAGVINNGNIPAIDFPVNFYLDGDWLHTTDMNESVLPGVEAYACWDWTVTDAVTPGVHVMAMAVANETGDNWWELEITIIGVPNVFVSNFTFSATSGYEGDNITLIAQLFNNGTANATNVTVEFFANDTRIGSTTANIPKNQYYDPLFVWTLPEVTEDTLKVLKVKCNGSERTINITVKNRAPKLEFTSFTVPDNLRPGMTVELKATLLNNGTADANGISQKFSDITPLAVVELNSTPSFNLSKGASSDGAVKVTIPAPGNANHTFVVAAGGVEMRIVRFVGTPMAPAAFKIVSFTPDPTKLTNKPKDSTQTVKLTLVLQNTGELAGTVVISITEVSKTIVTGENRTVAPGSNLTVAYDWTIKGSGDHTATLTIAIPGASSIGQTATVRLTYKSTGGGGAGGDSTGMLIAVVAIIAVVGGLAAFMMMRKKKTETPPPDEKPAKPEVLRYEPPKTESFQAKPAKPSVKPGAKPGAKPGPDKPAKPPETPPEDEFKP